jgi:hypothetical protein
VERTEALQIGGPQGEFFGGNHSGAFRLAKEGAGAKPDRSQQGMKDDA